MRKYFRALLCLTATFLVGAGVSAQTLSLDTFGVGSGGGTSSNSVFVVSGTITVPNVGVMSGGGFSASGDFLNLAASTAAARKATNIFDNTSGNFNSLGILYAPKIWLGSKFCVGAETYSLNSVKLSLTSRTPNVPTAVRLQIYSNDPVSGKPLASVGVIMKLQGETNPIVFTVAGERPVAWIPSTPLILQENRCYWAILNVEQGELMQPTSGNTGAAFAFGRAQSDDAGVTWFADRTTSAKMAIEGTGVINGAVGAPAFLVANRQTRIPGGTGNFTRLPFAPALSGENLVFYGDGSGGQQGLYLATIGRTGEPGRIADLRTPIPNGLGSFLSLGTEAGIIIVSGNIGVFPGAGTDGQQGLYAAVLRPEVTLPFRIADTATVIPGGIGTFASFPHMPAMSAESVIFSGTGGGSQRGIYAAAVRAGEVGGLFRVADTKTAMPNSAETFAEFPSTPDINGSTAVFVGKGNLRQQGIYGAIIEPNRAGPPVRIADTATTIPGGSGAFTEFTSGPRVNANMVVFGASGANGQRGIYGANLRLAGLRAASVEENTFFDLPFVIADTSTAIPAGEGEFTGFGALSVSDGGVAFLGFGANNQAGIYFWMGGVLRNVIALGQMVENQVVTGLAFSSEGLSGRQVAFQATLGDGSQGLYSVEIPEPPAALRITSAEGTGSGVKLKFTSSAGEKYAIQGRDHLSGGTWLTLAGPAILGTGATVEVTVPRQSLVSQQFYRVMSIP